MTLKPQLVRDDWAVPLAELCKCDKFDIWQVTLKRRNAILEIGYVSYLRDAQRFVRRIVYENGKFQDYYTPPFSVVPMGVNFRRQGPYFGKNGRTIYEVWDSNFLSVKEPTFDQFVDENQAKQYLEYLNKMYM